MGVVQRTGVRSGVLLAVIGLFLVLRTVNHDDSGRTLIDHILGKTASWTGSSKAGSAVTPLLAVPAATAAPSTAATRAQAAADLITVTAGKITSGNVRLLPTGVTVSANRVPAR